MTPPPDKTLLENNLLAPTFLFRFSLPCLYHDKPWSRSGVSLGEEYRLPNLGTLEDRPQFADVRACWHESGLSMTVSVEGKRKSLWCHESRMADSDGLMVWIDTRDTHTVHRATRFCHCFMFTPVGGGRHADGPIADQLLINRARENARPVPIDTLQARSEKRDDGYLLEAHIPAKALTGYDPSQQNRLGFMCAVLDRELGWQTLTIGTEFPIDEDPSLWCSLELVR